MMLLDLDNPWYPYIGLSLTSHSIAASDISVAWFAFSKRLGSSSVMSSICILVLSTELRVGHVSQNTPGFL